MKKEIILIVICLLAIAGLACKNNQIAKLKERERQLQLELSDYRWKYEHLNHICNMEEKNGKDN